jgi:oligopeptide transport system substrate-binding protein
MRRRAAAIPSICAALVLFACGPLDPRAPDEFRWAASAPEQLDPSLVSDEVGWNLILNLFEGLTCPTPTLDDFVPCGAESWEVSDDGKTWTFHLRGAARWSDGEPVTAHHYVYGLQRLDHPDTGAPYAALAQIFARRAVSDGAEGETAAATTLDVLAVDDRTLRVRLVYPVPYLLQLTSMPAFFPLRQDVIEAHGRAWVRPENMVGNGAYVLSELRPLDRIVIDANPRYWDRDSLGVKRATMFISDNEATVYRMYIAGEIDWDNAVPGSYIERLRRLRPREIMMVPTLSTRMVVLNLHRPPFDDARVRRSLSLAIDRAALVQHVSKGGDRPAGGVVPPMPELGYPGLPAIPHDAATARTLLADAGFAGGAGFPRVTFLYNTLDVNRRIAEALQEMWSRELNIEVRIENVEWKVYNSRLDERSFDLARFQWLGDFVDPMTFLQVFQSDSGNNLSGWSDPAYDEALDRSRLMVDPAARAEVLLDAEAAMIAAQPVIPLFHVTQPQLLREGITGLEPNPLDAHLLKHVSMPRP